MKKNKITALLLCLLMLLCSFSMAVSAEDPILPGDIDEDGEITPFDALMALEISAVYSLENSIYDDFPMADVFNRGYIDAACARAIARDALGIESLQYPMTAPSEPSALAPEIIVNQTVYTNTKKLIVDISVKNGDGLASGDFVLTYNPRQLSYVAADSNNNDLDILIFVADGYEQKAGVSFFAAEAFNGDDWQLTNITMVFNILADDPEIIDFSIRTLADSTYADCTENATVTITKESTKEAESFLMKLIRYFNMIIEFFRNLFGG